MTNENEHAAAVSAAEGEATTDAVVHPTDPPQPIEPVPDPQLNVGDPSVEAIEQPPADDVSEEELQHLRAAALDEPGEIIDVRESALEHIEIDIPDPAIEPTIGRKVWFWKNGSQPNVGQAEDATIVYVHGLRMVNLLVVDHEAVPRGEISVPLLQPGDERDLAFENGAFAEWMPFQKGQARAQGIPVARHVVLGDDVYYGNGKGEVNAAKVVGNAGFAAVDLIVFERERTHHVFGVLKADPDEPHLNGWAFKA